MVTRIRGRRQALQQPHLYIAEWMAYRGLTDERLAGRLGVARETVTRYRNQQHRLNPAKIAAIAAALDIKPAQLWEPPPPEGRVPRPSLDAMFEGAPDAAIEKLAEFGAILLKTGTGG